jgi:hypothetical protein
MLNFPTKKKSDHTIRDTLFGDWSIDGWGATEGSAEPWGSFAAARTAISASDAHSAAAALRRIIAMPGLESRHYLQAWHFLRQLGVQPPTDQAKNALGVVLEIALPQGLDLLAAYADGSARYYNYSVRVSQIAERISSGRTTQLTPLGG